MRPQSAFLLTFIVALCITAAPAFAIEKIGSALIGGKRVDIFDNGTWAYTETTQGDCKSLSDTLAFCGEASGWTATRPPAPDIIAQYQYDDRNYAQYVLEAVGGDDGMTIEFMRDAVLQNAAAASGVAATDIPVLDVIDVELTGYGGTTVVYVVTINGLNLVFANSIVVADAQSLQAMTFSVGKSYTDAHKALHASFLSHTRFQP
ncbi:MAG: hypothetical protein KJN93_07665 [Alphaproteobacteria bacterium]|nr:hypothetical protein [Alphaproteobacteria bacterium]